MSAAPRHPSEIKEWIRLSPGKGEGGEGRGGEGMGWVEQLGKETGHGEIGFTSCTKLGFAKLAPGGDADECGLCSLTATV